MTNREIYLHDPKTNELLNNGVAVVESTASPEELETLHYELSTFVCDGQYEAGLRRILESFIRNLDKPEQPTVWVSGFYGSGKSHLVKMLRALWVDTSFPDGSTARGLAKLPDSISDLLRELSTAGRRLGGLHAAAGTLGAGAGDHARRTVLEIVFRSVGLPRQYSVARFVMRLRDIGKLDAVRAAVEREGKSWDSELLHLTASPVIATALLDHETGFGESLAEVRETLRAQYPARDGDVSNDEMVTAIREALAPNGAEFPLTLIALDEVQQYIGSVIDRTRVIQEIAETCRTRFSGRLLLVATGQSALSDTAQLQRLQDRFRVLVHLSDEDVDTVIRKTVLLKRPDAQSRIEAVLKTHTGEISRHLTESKIGPRPEDEKWLVADYPLLPTRRRFWEKALVAIDQGGVQGQLRNQLKMVHEAARSTADAALGTVVGTDFLFDEQAIPLLQTGALSPQFHNLVERKKNGDVDDALQARLLALIYLIGKLPRQGAADLGVRAVPDTLADLLVTDLAEGSAPLRNRIPGLLERLVDEGHLMKIDGEYRLQTPEGAEWERDFRARVVTCRANESKISSDRAALLRGEVEKKIGKLNLRQGRTKTPREYLLHFGAEPPKTDDAKIPVWVRDGWSDDDQSFNSDARRAGNEDPTIFVWIPRRAAEGLNEALITLCAAQETLDARGVPSSQEGREARAAIENRRADVDRKLREEILPDIFAQARVVQAGGTELTGGSLHERIMAAAENSLVRLFPEFDEADDTRWVKALERARGGSGDPLQAIGHQAETEKHPVAAKVLAFIGAGKKGAEIQKHFTGSPYGWPSDAVDGAIYALLAAGHIRASLDHQPVEAGALERRRIAAAELRRENVVVTAAQRIALRKLLQTAGIPFTPNEEAAAVPALLARLRELAQEAGGEPPLPERPGTQHIEELAARSGNDQLVALAEARERLEQDLANWRAAGEKAKQRLERWSRLQLLLSHAEGMDGAVPVQEQIEAIREKRQLLHDPDPTEPQAEALVQLLRAALQEAEARYRTTFERELEALEATREWTVIEAAQREQIRRSLGLLEVPEVKTGTIEDVLGSLQAISLSEWRNRTDALPQRFQQARLEAARLSAPKARQVPLPKATLHSAEELKDWLERVESALEVALKEGPIII